MLADNKILIPIIQLLIFLQSMAYCVFKYKNNSWDILANFCIGMSLVSSGIIYLMHRNYEKFYNYSKYYTIVVLTAIPIITGQYSSHPAINFVYSSSIGLISIFIISLISSWTTSVIPWFLMYINITFVFFQAREQLMPLPSEPYVYYIIYIAIYFITYLISSIITFKYHKQKKDFFNLKTEIALLKAENISMVKELTDFNSEIEISSKIQRSFYPRSLEINNQNYDLYAYSKSYSKISGDYFDIFRNDKKIFFGIGDVTGHGMSSAIVSVIINRKFKTYVKLGVENIPEILQDLQEDLITVKNKLMTISIGYIDSESNVHIYGNQEIPIIATSDDCRALIESLDGFILGNSSFNIINIPYLNISLNQGEFIILYTDGVTEIENKNKESFGVAGLIEYIKENKDSFMKMSAKSIVHSILIKIREWSNNSFHDDTSLLVIKRK